MDVYIFDIVRSSLVDGPGVRTTVFFKGCNLNCAWCHNPEGKFPNPQPAFFADRCTGCGLCREVCPRKDGDCTLCGACVNICPENARRIYGRKYSLKELTEILLADVRYYRATGGGVTFSGGECMLYPRILGRLLRKLDEAGVRAAIDTAGNVPYASFQSLFSFRPLFLYDLKAVSRSVHKRGTGVDNRLILENLDRLISDRQDVIIRVPVIPGFNDGRELAKVRRYVAERGLTAEYLPFHTMGEGKQKALLAAGSCFPPVREPIKKTTESV